MKKRFCFVILISLLISSTATFSQNLKYSAKEKEEIKIFKDFKNYALQCIRNNCDINDTANLSYIISHYLFIDINSDSTNTLSHLSEEKLKNLKKSISSFFQYLGQVEMTKTSANLEVMPSRLAPDKNIYNRFTTFQKNNTLVFFDKQSPDKPLGYILFLPVIKGVSTTTKIWSWRLSFSFGKYFFSSATGEEGYEHIFESEK